MAGAEEFMRRALEVAARAAETQGDAIARAAELVLDARVFWVFGTGHSHVIAEGCMGAPVAWPTCGPCSSPG